MGPQLQARDITLRTLENPRQLLATLDGLEDCAVARNLCPRAQVPAARDRTSVGLVRGSWVVISGVISGVQLDITLFRAPITLLITTHEPSSITIPSPRVWDWCRDRVTGLTPASACRACSQRKAAANAEQMAL